MIRSSTSFSIINISISLINYLGLNSARDRLLINFYFIFAFLLGFTCFPGVLTRLVKNEKFALKFASSAFRGRLCTGWRQRPLARWFYPQLWLVHLNLSARWQHDPPPEGNVHLHDKMQIFRSSRVFRPPKHTYLEWKILDFVELLFLLRFGTFSFEEKAICGVTSVQQWMEWSAFPFF